MTYQERVAEAAARRAEVSAREKAINAPEDPNAEPDVYELEAAAAQLARDEAAVEAEAEAEAEDDDQ